MSDINYNYICVVFIKCVMIYILLFIIAYLLWRDYIKRHYGD